MADLGAVLTNKVTILLGLGTIAPPPKKAVLSPRASVTLGLFKAFDADGDGSSDDDRDRD